MRRTPRRGAKGRGSRVRCGTRARPGAATVPALALLLALPLALPLPLVTATAGRAVAASRVDTSCRQAPQKGEELPDQLPGRPLADRLGLAQAWDLAEGAGVTVAVVDSGVDHRHPELTGAVGTGAELVMVRTKAEYRIQRPKSPSLDCEGHGTAVAGLIAARRGGEGRITGVAPRARIHPVRMADGMENVSEKALAAAIDEAADSGARVLNLSFALPVDRAPVRKAIARAVDKDIVVVAAAGNEGNAGEKMYPAAYDGVLAVGAVGEDGQPMEESNQGSWVDLAAYGESEIVLAAGGSGYRRDKGTSYAAPQVSGAAALVRSRFPELSAEEVADRLLGSAAPVGGGRDARTGAGIVDPFGALTHLDGDSGATEAAAPGAIPVQAVPEKEPLLSPAVADAVAWSGGLLLAVLLALLGAPAVRRAVARHWRPGPVSGRPGRVTGPGARARTTPVVPAVLDRLTGPPGAPASRRITPGRAHHRPNRTP